jgi:hypothetical protein
MIKKVVFVIFVLLCVDAEGQEVFHTPARFKAVGNASVSLQSPLAVWSNPAGIALVKLTSVGLNYERRFLLDELQTTSAFLVIPIAKTNFGFSFYQFGYHAYRENKWSASVSKRLAERLLGGAQFHYHQLSLAENDLRSGALLVDLGIQFQLSEDFWLGAQLFNPSEVSLQHLAMSYDFPLIWRVGAHKLFEKTVLFTIEMKQWEKQAVGFCAGMEIQLKDQFQLRLGADSRQRQFAMGVGYSLQHFQTDLTFTYHQVLGYTPSFSIYYQLP